MQNQKPISFIIALGLTFSLAYFAKKTIETESKSLPIKHTTKTQVSSSDRKETISQVKKLNESITNEFEEKSHQIIEEVKISHNSQIEKLESKIKKINESLKKLDSQNLNSMDTDSKEFMEITKLMTERENLRSEIIDLKLIAMQKRLQEVQ